MGRRVGGEGRREAGEWGGAEEVPRAECEGEGEWRVVADVEIVILCTLVRSGCALVTIILYEFIDVLLYKKG